METLADMIRFYRKQSGLTQHQLADIAGIGKTVVFDIEKGKESIRFDNVKKILEVLNIRLKFEPPFTANKPNS